MKGLMLALVAVILLAQPAIAGNTKLTVDIYPESISGIAKWGFFEDGMCHIEVVGWEDHICCFESGETINIEKSGTVYFLTVDGYVKPTPVRVSDNGKSVSLNGSYLPSATSKSIAGSGKRKDTRSEIERLFVWRTLHTYFASPKTQVGTPQSVFEKLDTALQSNYLGLYLGKNGDVLFWAPMGDALHFMTNPPSFYTEDERAALIARRLMDEVAGRCLGYNMDEWNVTSGELEIRKGFRPEIELSFTLANSNGVQTVRTYRGSL